MKQLDFIFGPHRTVGQAYIFSEERPRPWDHFLVMVCFTGVEGNYRSGRKKCLAGWKVQNDEQRVNFRLWPTECCKIANVGKSMKKSDGNIVDVIPEVIQNLVEIVSRRSPVNDARLPEEQIEKPDIGSSEHMERKSSPV